MFVYHSERKNDQKTHHDKIYDLTDTHESFLHISIGLLYERNISVCYQIYSFNPIKDPFLVEDFPSLATIHHALL